MILDDHRRLAAIEAAPDQRTSVELIAAYWRDGDRADRTPRQFLYLHLGMLIATAAEATGAQLPPPRVTLVPGPEREQ